MSIKPVKKTFKRTEGYLATCFFFGGFFGVFVGIQTTHTHTHMRMHIHIRDTSKREIHTKQHTSKKNTNTNTKLKETGKSQIYKSQLPKHRKVKYKGMYPKMSIQNNLVNRLLFTKSSKNY